MSGSVLLLAHGTPDSLDELEDYLTLVRGGRRPSPELLAELRHNYTAIGGRSPLTDITRAQAAALGRELGGRVPVWVGMRSWKPFVADALSEAARAGARDVLVIPMAPQLSALTAGRYRAAVEQATPDGVSVKLVESWHAHPLFLDALAEKVRLALDQCARDAVLFSAHSLPERVIREGDLYASYVRVTAEGVAARVGLADVRLAYQSAGRTPEPWIGPSLVETLGELAATGKRSVLVVPVCFVSDHLEVLYDIDVAAREAARRLGLDLTRTESLNTAPLLIRALADLVRRHG
jgi:ferrochelatase